MLQEEQVQEVKWFGSTMSPPSMSGRFTVKTTKGSTSRTKCADLHGAAALLAGDVRDLMADFYEVPDTDEFLPSPSRAVYLHLDAGWSADDAWRIFVSVSGPDENEVTGFTANLRSRLAYTVENLTPPSPAPANQTPIQDSVTALPRRTVRVPSEATFKSVRIPLDGLRQIEEELSRYGQVGVESDDFDGVTSTSDLAALNFKKPPTFKIFASPTGSKWGGVRVSFDESSTRLSHHSDEPAARSSFSRVRDILESYSRNWRRRLRVVCGIVGTAGLASSIGIDVGTVNRPGFSGGWVLPRCPR